MALEKQAVTLNFAQGLDLKTDPRQLALGKFLELENSVFDKNGRFEKRNGFGSLADLPTSDATFLTTLNGSLVAVGNQLDAFSSTYGGWVTKGKLQPVTLSAIPVVRTNYSQSQCDMAVAPNGSACIVFTDETGPATYKYEIFDFGTGQSIVSPTIVTPTAGTITSAPKVFCLGSKFVIIFTASISGVGHLQYIAISSLTPSAPMAPQDISSASVASANGNFDAVAMDNNLYIAWSTTAAGGTIRMTYFDPTLTQHNTIQIAGHSAKILSLTADAENSILYVSWINTGATGGYVAARNNLMSEVFAPVQFNTESVSTCGALTSFAANGQCTLLYNYSGVNTIDPLTFQATVSQAGAVTSAETDFGRGLLLASKAFIVNGVGYVLEQFISDYQSTLFLLDENAEVVAKLAYSNASNVVQEAGLPGVSVSGLSAKIPYLYKATIQAASKAQGESKTGVYGQLGINAVTFEFTTASATGVEIANVLNINGGFLWMFDGSTPVEQGFFLYPDYVEQHAIGNSGAMAAQIYYYVAVYEWEDAQGNVHRSAPSIPQMVDATNSAGLIAFDGYTNIGDYGISSVSSLAGLQIGQFVDGFTNPGTFPAGTYITALVDDGLGNLSVETNNAALEEHIPPEAKPTFHVTSDISVQVYVPTLRQTYKTTNPIKITLYRWSTAQQTYYQVTSVTSPTLNDKTVDRVLITDTLSDYSILGNNILYTTGGVVENIAPPASDTMTLWNSRLFLVSSEDKNILWFSKQIIPNTPVEMSDLFTIYVSPSVGAQGTTGPITALTPMDDKLIIFKNNAIYYMNGVGPDNTGNNNQFSEPAFITSTVGCANPSSVVVTPTGIMFQSDKGIWLLSRDLTTQYIGAPVENYNESNVNSALTIAGTNQVRFTLDTGETLVYDYFFGQWSTFTNLRAISACLFENKHTYITANGKAYQETPGIYLDGTKPVLLGFKTGWINLAGLQGLERLYFMFLTGEYFTPFKLAMRIAYDFNKASEQEILITPDNYSPAWGGDPLWGSSTPWGGPGTAFEARLFPKKQKCSSFQISAKEFYDPSLGVAAGAGLSLSGLNLVVGVKKGYRTQNSGRSFG